LTELNSALLKEDPETVLKMLKSGHLGIKNVKDENIELYMQQLKEARQVKKVNKIKNVKDENIELYMQQLKEARQVKKVNKIKTNKKQVKT